MNAGGTRFAVQRQIQLFTVFTHPADLSGRDAHHQGIGGDIPVNHGTGADEGVFADGGATHDGAIGAEGGAFFHPRVAIFAFALDQRAGVVDIGEHHAGAAEHAFFQGDVVVHADVVLDFAVIADDHFIADKDILTQ